MRQYSAKGSTLNVSGDVHAFGIPAPVVYIGVAPRAQVVITPPSFVQVSTSRLGIVAAGASDMSFEYKQLMFVDPAKFTMVALDLRAYQTPSRVASLPRARANLYDRSNRYATTPTQFRPHARVPGKQLHGELFYVYD